MRQVLWAAWLESRPRFEQVVDRVLFECIDGIFVVSSSESDQGGTAGVAALASGVIVLTGDEDEQAVISYRSTLSGAFTGSTVDTDGNGARGNSISALEIPNIGRFQKPDLH